MTERGQPHIRLLWILRHAKAVPDPPPGGADHERPLTSRGRMDAAALGRRLGAGDLDIGTHDLPSIVLCSTATRTTETARHATAAFQPLVDRRRRLYYGSPEDVLAEVQTVDDEIRSVMVVGHNPTAHSLALGLLADDDVVGRAALSSLPTCAMALFELHASCWRDAALGSATLRMFVSPPY